MHGLTVGCGCEVQTHSRQSALTVSLTANLTPNTTQNTPIPSMLLDHVNSTDPSPNPSWPSCMPPFSRSQHQYPLPVHACTLVHSVPPVPVLPLCTLSTSELIPLHQPLTGLLGQLRELVRRQARTTRTQTLKLHSRLMFLLPPLVSDPVTYPSRAQTPHPNADIFVARGALMLFVALVPAGVPGPVSPVTPSYLSPCTCLLRFSLYGQKHRSSEVL